MDEVKIRQLHIQPSLSIAFNMSKQYLDFTLCKCNHGL